MKQGHVYLYGEIVPFHGSDAEDWGVISVATVKNQIEKLDKDVEEIVLHINSVGGALYEAYAIFDFLSSVGKPFVTKAEGTVASAATVIFLIAKKREVTRNTVFLIHPPSNGYFGTADDLQRSADELRQEEVKLADFYNRYTGSDANALLEIMKEDKPLPIDQVLSLNFATAVVDPVQAIKNKQEQQIEQMKKNIKTAASIVANAFNELRRLGMPVNTQDSPVASVVKTADGKELNIEMQGDKIAVGDTVTLVEDGSSAPDGEHTLEDGTVIVTAGGVITEVKEASAETSSDEEIENLKKENESLKAKLQSLEDKITNLSSVTNERDQLINTLDTVTNHLKTLKVNFVPPSPQANFNQNKNNAKTENEIQADQIAAKFDKIRRKK
jgi:ATP-dependent protease ClpP protease subunit/uncharacterized cupredoxin-like copper-binding protein